MDSKKKPKVVIDDPDEIGKPVLAKAIVAISESANALRRSGLNKRAIVVLVGHTSKVPMRTVERVLDGLDQLRDDYTR